jgi:integrase
MFNQKFVHMTTLDFSYVFFARPSSVRGDITKTGVPIYMRIKYKGKEKVLATGINGPHNKWARHLQRFNSDSRFALTANRKLDDMMDFVKNRYWRMEQANEEYDFDAFISKLMGKEEVITLLSLFETRINQLSELVGRTYTNDTVKLYKNALHHLKGYFAEIGKKDIAIKQIKQSFIMDFYEYLIRRVSVNTANKVLRKLKAVLNYAVGKEMLDKDPFHGWKLKDDKVNRQPLTIEEIKRILSIETNHEGVLKVRDVFVFQCLTGLAHVDVEALEHKHIINEGGNIYIDKIRHKTKNRAIIPLIPQAIEILERYKTYHPEKALPVYTLQTMNKYLRAVKELAKIQKPITTHIGRHTFASTIATNNGIAREHVEAMMALTSSKMVHVYAKMNVPVINQAMKQVAESFSL